MLLEPKLELRPTKDFFDRRFLLPYRARMIPDHRVLRQLVDAPTYARWQVLKKRYIGGDYHVEHWRPLYAAQDLYGKALRALDLSTEDGVVGMVETLAKRDGVSLVPVVFRVTIQRPRAATKAFWMAAPNDLGCFRHTLDSIEYDLPTITARANAWSTGDLETLRRLPESHRLDTCVNAISSSGFAQQLGIADTSTQLEVAWLAAARQVLASTPTSFALLPMGELLSPTGYLSKLKAQGYTVESPEQLDASSAAR